jgi:hypothetical protein
MIERREINLKISKDELLRKILASYEINEPSESLLKALRVSLTGDSLLIVGTEESLVADMSPEFNDLLSTENSAIKKTINAVLPAGEKWYKISSPEWHSKCTSISRDKKLQFHAIPGWISLTEKESQQYGLFNELALQDTKHRYFINSAITTTSDVDRFFLFGEGGLVRRFDNTYLVNSDDHLDDIPPHVNYCRKSGNIWQMCKMTGETDTRGRKQVEVIKNGITLFDALTQMGYEQL